MRQWERYIVVTPYQWERYSYIVGTPWAPFPSMFYRLSKHYKGSKCRSVKERGSFARRYPKA